jgi:hypothetical protein
MPELDVVARENAGFDPEDIAWTEAALSRHYGEPIRLYAPPKAAPKPTKKRQSGNKGTCGTFHFAKY